VVDVKRAADRISEDIDVLAGTIGERNMWRLAALQRAAAYITERLESAGFTPAVQEYPVEGARVQNIEAALAGSTDTAPSVIIGAHYDTVIGCPGANDNATGVAAMLELARRFAGQPHRRTVRFVAFVNEEPPFFQTAAMGSLVYAKEAKRRGDRIAAMLSLETIGYYSDRPNSQQYPVAPLALFYPNTGNFIAFVSNIGSVSYARCGGSGGNPRRWLVRSLVLLAGRVPGHHGDGHGAVPLSLVSHAGRHSRQSVSCPPRGCGRWSRGDRARRGERLRVGFAAVKIFPLACRRPSARLS
jgi:hypothetical protein